MRVKPLFRGFASVGPSQDFALRIGMLAFAVFTLFPWSVWAQTDRANDLALYDNRESPATPLIVRFFVRSLTASEMQLMRNCG